MEKQHLTHFAGSAAKRSFPYRLAGLVNLDLAALQPSGMFIMSPFKMLVTCPRCGSSHETYKSRPQLYCSIECWYNKKNDPHYTREVPSSKCVICGISFRVRPSRLRTAKYCSYKCHQIGSGKKGGAVRAKQMKQSSLGKAYIKRNCRHLHRQIAEEILGRALVPGEVVHHKDGNILNNQPSNIEVFPSQSEHCKAHGFGKIIVRKALQTT